MSEPISALKARYNSARTLWAQERYHETIQLTKPFLQAAIHPPDDSSGMYYGRMAVLWATCEYRLGRKQQLLVVYDDYQQYFHHLLPATQVRVTKWAGTTHLQLGNYEEAERLYLLAFHRARNDSLQRARVIGDLDTLYIMYPELLSTSVQDTDIRWLYAILVPLLTALLVYIGVRIHHKRTRTEPSTPEINFTEAKRTIQNG